MIARRLLILGACALTLSACGGNLIGPTDEMQTFIVRPTFPPASEGAKVNWSLSILRPDVPGGLDSDRIALYQPGGVMDFYAKAQYPDRLPATVQRAVLDGFEASGRIDAVAREEDALHADYNLLIEVKDFAAHYASQDGVPATSVVLVAKLTTNHGRKILATKTFAVPGNASVNSAAAAAQALQQSLATAVTQVVAWTLDTAPAIVPGTSPDAATNTATPGKNAAQLLHDVTRGTGKTAPPQ